MATLTLQAGFVKMNLIQYKNLNSKITKQIMYSINMSRQHKDFSHFQ